MSKNRLVGEENPHIVEVAPLGEHIDGFREWLIIQGFAAWTVERHVSGVQHLQMYLRSEGLSDFEELHLRHICDFVEKHLPKCRCPGHRQRKARDRYCNTRYAVHRFIEYTREQQLSGHLDAPLPAYAELRDLYCCWLKDYCDCAWGTVEVRKGAIGSFLDWLGDRASVERVGEVTQGQIETFFLDFASGAGQAQRRTMQATLRTFLRFCHNRGYCVEDLSKAVPTLRTYALASVPRGVNEEQAQAALDSISPNSVCAKRDHAMLLMLLEYGVRGGQVRALCLSDIDWQGELIRFPALKLGRECWVPLTDRVGSALLDYLRKERPDAPHPQVFLTSRAPYRPLRASSCLSNRVNRLLRLAGVSESELKRAGAHSLRHGFAARMLEHGQPLKVIADFLGHKAIQTTFIYTKVDHPHLAEAAMPWPGEVIS